MDAPVAIRLRTVAVMQPQRLAVLSSLTPTAVPPPVVAVVPLFLWLVVVAVVLPLLQPQSPLPVVVAAVLLLSQHQYRALPSI